MILAFSLWSMLFAFGKSPTITTASLPQAQAGQPYIVQWTATSGKTPYRWTSGALPSGLALSTSGLMSGKPIPSGTFLLAVRVTDARQQTASKSLPLTIQPAPPPLVIQTLTIPDGMVGKPFSFQIVVSGGTPPYACTPDPVNNLAEFGLVLESSCLLHGTPTKAGQVTF